MWEMFLKGHVLRNGGDAQRVVCKEQHATKNIILAVYIQNVENINWPHEWELDKL
jgi:hypothetical protein